MHTYTQTAPTNDDTWPKYRVVKNFEGYAVERQLFANSPWETQLTRVGRWNYYAELGPAQYVCNRLMADERERRERKAAREAFVPEYYYPPFNATEVAEIAEAKAPKPSWFKRLISFVRLLERDD
jgi:hypothetical protein